MALYAGTVAGHVVYGAFWRWKSTGK
jgi:hypothetical protein